MNIEINTEFILLVLIIMVMLYICKVFLDLSDEKQIIPHDPLIHKREHFDGTGKGFSIYYKPTNTCDNDVYPGSYITSRAINDSHDCIVSKKRMVSLK